MSLDYVPVPVLLRPDTQHNDTQRKDTQHNDSQPNGTQNSDAQHNDTQHKGPLCENQHNNAIMLSINVLRVAFYLLLCRMLE
jgi:hypothetical protein